MSHVCGYLQRTEDNIRFHETEVTDSCELPDLSTGVECGTSGRPEITLDY